MLVCLTIAKHYSRLDVQSKSRSNSEKGQKQSTTQLNKSDSQSQQAKGDQEPEVVH